MKDGRKSPKKKSNKLKIHSTDSPTPRSQTARGVLFILIFLSAIYHAIAWII